MVPLIYNLRSLRARRATSAFTVLGLALVVFVLAAALMLVQGIERTFRAGGSDDSVVVLRKGSDGELASYFDQQHLGLLLSAPGVAAGGDGPVAHGEVMLVILLEKPGGPYVANVRLRGVPAAALHFHRAWRIVAGRPPRPGTAEVAIGQRLVGRFKGLQLGQRFELKKNRPVQVVGVFAAGGASFESEIWGDLDVVRDAFGREATFSLARVRLTSPSQFAGFKAAVESDQRLQLEALREADYYAKQSEGTAAFIGGLGVVIALFFALGAMIGATITMHAAVAQRRREIGTLRALGFSRSAVLLSFLLESTVLALVGGALGVGGALLLSLAELPLMDFSGWSEMIFRFVPTPTIIGTALLFGCGMGLLGGLWPALRAARTVAAEAIRA
ncbi:MAG: ABC transporter permease [Proteobacteria bacterium]|nr:ABC transporter permease [Pseudomonadota bacterium]